MRADPILARLGLAPVLNRWPLPGYLMIAGRDNNRVIVVSPAERIVWRFPPSGSGVPGAFTQPDDAFVSADRSDISINQEFAETITLVTLTRQPRIVWQYGHYGAQGSAPGYLGHPDDAYCSPRPGTGRGHHQLPRALDHHAKRIIRALGTAGDCNHNPPSALSDPNGDTPLPGGGVLVTESAAGSTASTGTGR